MLTIPLQSGSNGNCLYVETDGAKLLFDAGISGKQAEARLAMYDRDIRDVDGVIISHDHSDHSRCAGIFNRKFGIPVYITKDTLRATMRRNSVGVINDVRHFRAGLPVNFGKVVVETLPTPHDGADGSVFVVDDGKRRLGVMTDLGHIYKDLVTAVETLDAVYLESNYDPDMLENGPYPRFLKRRISGRGGHISNVEAANLIKRHAPNAKWVCLAHLSEENNTPEIAYNTNRKILGEGFNIHVAKRYEVSEPLEL